MTLYKSTFKLNSSHVLKDAYISDQLHGFVHSIHYVPFGVSGKDFDSFGITVTSVNTGVNILTRGTVTSAFHAYPRPIAQKITGVDYLYAAGEEVVVPEGFGLIEDFLKVTLTTPGVDKLGELIVIMKGWKG